MARAAGTLEAGQRIRFAGSDSTVRCVIRDRSHVLLDLGGWRLRVEPEREIEVLDASLDRIDWPRSTNPFERETWHPLTAPA